MEEDGILNFCVFHVEHNPANALNSPVKHRLFRQQTRQDPSVRMMLLKAIESFQTSKKLGEIKNV